MRLTSWLIASLTLCAAAAQAATPTHVYLMNDASEALAGPALVTQGGSFSGGHYEFGANQGFSVSGAVPDSVYTLDFSFSIDHVDGYRRLVEFRDLSADLGVYVLNGGLNFYPLTTGSPVVGASQAVRVTLTRDASGLFTGYVDGAQQIQFDDSVSQLAVFSGPSQVAWFFRDDNAIGGEASAGRVDYLQVFGTALTGAEIAQLTSPVPEPASGLMALGGIIALLAARRRASTA